MVSFDTIFDDLVHEVSYKERESIREKYGHI